jgi:hypothetical protein
VKADLTGLCQLDSGLGHDVNPLREGFTLRQEHIRFVLGTKHKQGRRNPAKLKHGILGNGKDFVWNFDRWFTSFLRESFPAAAQ